MKKTVNGLFKKRKLAEEAIAILKEKGYTKDISILAREEKTRMLTGRDIKKDVKDGTVTGAATGATIGAAAAILTGLTSIFIPGFGAILLGGPLFAGLAGATAGAMTGGAVGALVDLGIPEETARMYEGYLHAGEVLVSITVPKDRSDEVADILRKGGSHKVEFVDY